MPFLGKILLPALIMSGLSALAQSPTTELVACGDSLLRIFRFHGDSLDPQPIFTWHVGESRNLPPEAYRKFQTIDECKPLPQRGQILLTSSYEGGVGLLDRRTKQLLFYASAPNAHSAEWLPGNRLAVALSTAPGGNRVVVYNLTGPNRAVWSDSLYSAHGLRWDEKKATLYALDYDQLREYTPAADGNGFVLRKTHRLPDADGHELQAIPGTDSLLVSTHRGVWVFDQRTQRFGSFEPLAGMDLVKSVSLHPTDHHRVAYIRAEEKWWGNHVHFLGKKSVALPGIKWYKVRWWVHP